MPLCFSCAAVDVNCVAYSLKSVERDPNGKEDSWHGELHSDAENPDYCTHGLRCKVEVLEASKKPQAPNQASHEGHLPGTLGSGSLDEVTCSLLQERHAGEKEDVVSLPCCVEVVACSEQESPAKSVRNQPVRYGCGCEEPRNANELSDTCPPSSGGL